MMGSYVLILVIITMSSVTDTKVSSVKSIYFQTLKACELVEADFKKTPNSGVVSLGCRPTS
jgi:hypothetical protein